MTPQTHSLYELLPAHIRLRDGEQGGPLRALIGVIGEQFDALEADIAKQYSNWFIETCDDWAAPYIGELIGYRPVAAPGRGGNSPRAEVANLLGFRRRKGTLALLEELAASVAGWPARAVEFHTLLGWTQHAGHVRLDRGRTVDLRDGDALERLGGAFDTLAHGCDVRRMVAPRSPGRHAIGNVGLFAWRLRTHPVTAAPACCIESEGSHCFSFSVLGNDTPLFAAATPETAPTTIAREANLPVPIRRRALERIEPGHPPERSANLALYGAGKSIAIYSPDWPARGAPQPIPAAHIRVADLSGWSHRPKRDTILLDPQSGRMAFPARQLPGGGVWVDYRSALSADIGGGEYARALLQPAECLVLKVVRKGGGGDGGEETFDSISRALGEWRARQDDHGSPRAAVIEIQDSGAYTEALTVALEPGEYLQIRAAERTRPTIRLLDYLADGPDAFTVSGKAGSRLVLDGLLIAGRGIRLLGPDRHDVERFAQGDLCDLVIRHSTLVPGWGLTCDCEPRRSGEPSIAVTDSAATIRIAHSIVGAIQVFADEVRSDPVRIEASDSVIDATRADRAAIAATNLPFAFAELSLARCTVFGRIEAFAMRHAENCIFTGTLRIARRQGGCIRFSYVPPGSSTPQLSNCQPKLAVEAAAAAEKSLVETRVRPHFTSVRYGNPAYAQLSRHCPREIAAGADDESEMGVFHHLYQPQRAAALTARLAEFTPARSSAGLVFAN